jgi:hypothetical protein
MLHPESPPRSEPADPPDPRELLRQRLLLHSLWQRGPDAQLTAWLRDDPDRARRALAAYRGNGRALAERALAAAFPTVSELVGPESFAGLARAFWQAHPPVDGDIARHGEALAEFIQADAQLASEPYLADVARLDWAVHRADPAADAGAAAFGLEHLAGPEAVACRLRLRPGTALLQSRWPVVSIWLAHRSSEPDRFAPMRAAMARGEAQCALVRREGWRVAVEQIEAGPDIAFTAAVLDGRALGDALDRAGPDFDFQAWLVRALQQQWLQAVLPPPTDPDPCPRADGATP